MDNFHTPIHRYNIRIYKQQNVYGAEEEVIVYVEGNKEGEDVEAMDDGEEVMME